MGSKAQQRPKHLGRKLLQIRKALGLSQSDMLRHLGAGDSVQTARISEYESGAREPSLWILLGYGRVARVHLESLIDDEATLPDEIPGNFDFARYKNKLVPISARQKMGNPRPRPKLLAEKLLAIREILNIGKLRWQASCNPNSYLTVVGSRKFNRLAFRSMRMESASQIYSY